MLYWMDWELKTAPDIWKLAWRSQLDHVILLQDIKESQNTILKEGFSETM